MKTRGSSGVHIFSHGGAGTAENFVFKGIPATISRFDADTSKLTCLPGRVSAAHVVLRELRGSA